jgi:hypothetical protein
MAATAAPASPFTGVGLYTPAEVAAFLGEKPQDVRRWAFGYTRRRRGGRVDHPPLIATELPEVEGKRALTFVELVELMYVRGFYRAGASWPLIRKAARVAARIFGTAHPFALRRFFADPGGIYALLEEADGGESLVELVGHGQHALHQLVRPYLGQLDFDPHDVARRWWPMGREGHVVLDPRVSFGAPLVDAVGIPARALTEAFDAEAARTPRTALDQVAWIYQIEPRHVESALRFRSWLRRAA